MTNNKTMNLDNFFDETRVNVDNKIIETIKDPKIVSALQGGKRLRSLLAHLTFKACTQGFETPDQYQKALEGTVSIELAHGASLIHDDIIDKDVERRGKPAFHIKEGIGKALLTGHKMLANGFEIALSHSREVAKLYVESWNNVVSGEIKEVDYNKVDSKSLNMNTKEQIFEAYHKIIDLKTAELFSSACKAGALEADMAGDILKVFADYGREIGLAYQLADDLVDLVNGEIIDTVVVPILNRLEKKPLFNIMKKRQIKKMFNKNEDKIKELYIQEVKKHVQKAQKISKSKAIPDSSYKKLLFEAPNYIINRMLREINLSI